MAMSQETYSTQTKPFVFYKCLPDRIPTSIDEKCHGGKLSKDIITVLLTCNMNGPQKLKLLIIGKSAKPCCFKGIKSLPTTNPLHKNSWMTTELFNEWLTLLNANFTVQNN